MKRTDDEATITNSMKNIHERNGLAGDKMAIDADRTQDWIFDQIIHTRNKSKHGEAIAGGGGDFW